ncbi:tRNA dihydrouridine synthase [Sunxiuqinia elliptica]|uniref:tRNA-dihydrouridine synthase n=1 Tax=Sunxiuqinia elliptica TaxID=655355 RepID=A0A4R6GYM4_9BACT|nr:tRNA-dihydrouridine synthase [Sunxiuqinia elliptica]TDN99965.1 nifR3 family TIM-barrel protein [Sunxiuqinia elliptica]TDO57157.1 nifR3 family TIM-barrel protein [Sunxiuqinia elliptica]
MSNFWNEIEGPILALAPMEDVTDTSFRELVVRLSEPGCLHLLFTEFTAVDGMNHPVGKKRVSERLIVSDSERAILKEKGMRLIAQIWGNKPEVFHKVTREITEEYQFDGIDINMGCPAKNVVKQGSCSALIGSPELAQEIVYATKEATHLPVSIKTRTGLKTHETERWITQLLETKPAAITLHGRVQKQQSDGEANWEEIAKAVAIRNKQGLTIPILGNGDVLSYAQSMDYSQQYGVDGIMIGRGIFHNPWFFNLAQPERTKDEKLEQLVKHTQLFEKNWGGVKNFNILKRFYKIYANGFEGASQLRAKLMGANSFDDVYQLVNAQNMVLS